MSKLYIPTRRSIYLALGNISRALGFPDQKVFILCYHSISNDGWDFSVSLKEFTRQMKYLKSRYKFVSLEEISEYISGKIEITEPSVAITFDDGYEDILSTVPLLKKLGVKPTVFVISNRGSENISELQTKRKFLTKRGLQNLIKNGWEIGSHTRTHPDMSNLTPSQVQDEVVLSKTEIERFLKIKVNAIAFPKGRYNKMILDSVKKAKYKLALTMNDDKIDHNVDLFQLPRIGVDGTHSFNEFKVLSSNLVVAFRKFLKEKYEKQK